MNTKLFAAASVAAFAMAAAAPAMAGEGYIDAGFAKAEAGAGNIDGYTASAAYSTAPAVGSFGFQGNLVGMDFDGASDPAIGAQVTAYKQGENTRYGAYGSYSDSFGLDSWEVGGLVQWMNEQVIVSGQVGYGDVDTGASTDYLSYGVNVAFYLKDNVSLRGGVTILDVDAGGSADIIGVNLEWKPERLPVSILAGYNGYDPTGPAPSRVDVFSLGVRYSFGGQSLRDRDQKGLISTITPRVLF